MASKNLILLIRRLIYKNMTNKRTTYDFEISSRSASKEWVSKFKKAGGSQSLMLPNLRVAEEFVEKKLINFKNFN